MADGGAVVVASAGEVSGSQCGRDAFTVVLKPMPKHASAKQVKQLVLHKLAVKCRKVTHSGPCAFVLCASEQDMLDAISKLDGAVLKGVTLRARQATPASGVDSKRSRVAASASVPTECRMLDVVTPLRSVPYVEQLAMKKKNSLTLADQLRTRLRQCAVPADRLQFTVESVIPSPITSGYRNKCEFAVGRSPAGELTVGFVCGRRPDAGAAYVFPISNCCHVSAQVKKFVADFEARVLRVSKLEIFDEKERKGVWKMLTVRCFPGDMMAIVTVGFPHPSKSAPSATEAHAGMLDALRRELSVLTDGAVDLSRGYYLTSLFLAHQVDISDEPIYDRLWGAPYIYETLMDLRFRVSPGAFFQTNSAAAEKLYTTIIEKAQLSADDVVLDLCCGTGTIGLCVARHACVRCVIGVELCAPAVDDARRNCADNASALGSADAPPCRFACGRAEDVFKDLKYLAPNQADGSRMPFDGDGVRIVAIVDPPRAGLHSRLIHAMRSAKSVHRLIYVSCEPKLASDNFVNLCRPVSNKYTGDCFVLRSITPVDMFPMTELCEWVMVFERS